MVLLYIIMYIATFLIFLFKMLQSIRVYILNAQHSKILLVQALSSWLLISFEVASLDWVSSTLGKKDSPSLPCIFPVWIPLTP